MENLHVQVRCSISGGSKIDAIFSGDVGETWGFTPSLKA